MFSAIISIKFSASASFSISPPFHIPVMQMLVCLILFHKSFKQSSLYFILFVLFLLLWLYEFHYHVFEFTHPVFASYSLLLNSPNVFHSIIVFFNSVTSIWYFNIFCLCWNSLFVHPFFLWAWQAFLWLLFLPYKSLISVSLRSFSEVWSYSFLERIPLFLHFPWLCFGFYALDKSCLSHSGRSSLV